MNRSQTGKDNTIIKGLWVGERLPTMQQLSIASFLSHGHEYHLYVYSQLDQVPAGAVLKDANEIIPRSQVFRNANANTFAAFSDFFRYKLLLDKGGWWADADMICLRPFDFEEEYVFSSEHVICHEQTNTGVIKAPAGSEIMKFAWESCNKKDRTNLTWAEVGPDLLAEAVLRFSLQKYVRPAITFCPLLYDRWDTVVHPSHQLRFDRSSYSVHLWHDMWRRSNWSVDAEYAPGCFYENLKKLYLPTGEQTNKVNSRPECARAQSVNS